MRKSTMTKKMMKMILITGYSERFIPGKSRSLFRRSRSLNPTPFAGNPDSGGGFSCYSYHRHFDSSNVNVSQIWSEICLPHHMNPTPFVGNPDSGMGGSSAITLILIFVKWHNWCNLRFVSHIIWTWRRLLRIQIAEPTEGSFFGPVTSLIWLLPSLSS